MSLRLDKLALKERKTNRHFYGFEYILFEARGFEPLKKRMAIGELQLIAEQVWAAEKGMGPCPGVVLLPKKSDYYAHYSYIKRQVQLRPLGCNLGTLLHELAHGLGINDKLSHGPAFRRRCIRLLITYGGWNGVVNFEPTIRRKS